MRHKDANEPHFLKIRLTEVQNSVTEMHLLAPLTPKEELPRAGLRVKLKSSEIVFND